MKNPFFKNKGPFKINKLLKLSGIKNLNTFEKDMIKNVNDLNNAKNNEITFFHSKNYEKYAKNTNASYCVTTNKLKNYLPKKCKKIITDNVILTMAKITKCFYPDSVNDYPDNNLKKIENTNYKNKIIYGKNVLLGKNVSIGKNSVLGNNVIIENCVVIGKNCIISSNVIIKNSIIGDDVHILDSCILGKKGFGFFPSKKVNFRYPHIGSLIIESGCEIGCGSTIDRGSMSNTKIGQNTFLDNQVHVAHNVKIGKNCIIAGQVGFAGSSTIGDNVMIGGQAGISGHLKIGNNVHIAGGSGVIKDIPDNTKVMGYPAKDLRSFLKENK